VRKLRTSSESSASARRCRLSGASTQCSDARSGGGVDRAVA
jgi:hypothetical protein